MLMIANGNIIPVCFWAVGNGNNNILIVVGSSGLVWRYVSRLLGGSHNVMRKLLEAWWGSCPSGTILLCLPAVADRLCNVYVFSVLG